MNHIIRFISFYLDSHSFNHGRDSEGTVTAGTQEFLSEIIKWRDVRQEEHSSASVKTINFPFISILGFLTLQNEALELFDLIYIILHMLSVFKFILLPVLIFLSCQCCTASSCLQGELLRMLHYHQRSPVTAKF